MTKEIKVTSNEYETTGNETPDEPMIENTVVDSEKPVDSDTIDDENSGDDYDRQGCFEEKDILFHHYFR